MRQRRGAGYYAVTGMLESPGRNLADTRSSSAYAESLLAELLVPRKEDFPSVKTFDFFSAIFLF